MNALTIGGLTVDTGEIVALLGGNGAGKTTLLETVLGFLPGAVSLFGRDVARLSVEQRVALGVGYVPERRRVFAGLTVRENLEAASSLPADGRRRRVEEMLALFPMLGERPDARAWLLSGGQQQMLALARAEMGGAKLLLLDDRGNLIAKSQVQERPPSEIDLSQPIGRDSCLVTLRRNLDDVICSWQQTPECKNAESICYSRSFAGIERCVGVGVEKDQHSRQPVFLELSRAVAIDVIEDPATEGPIMNYRHQ